VNRGELCPRVEIVAVLLAVLSLGPSPGCGGGSKWLGGRVDGGAAGQAGTSPATGPGRAGAPGLAPPRPFCGAAGSLLLPSARGNVCSSTVAAQAFRFSLCTCAELSWIGSLTTDSFDSVSGQPGRNADVGVDGYLVAAQAYQIGGSLWIAGEPAGAPALRVVSATASGVAGDLRVGGGIVGQGLQTVQGDLFSGGDILCRGLSVGGTIHLPPGSVVAGASAARGIVQEPVTVDRPCNCATPALDTARMVEELGRSNDNAAAGLDPTTLDSFLGPRTLELPCGRYHFEQISGRDLTWRLQGRAAISVAGDLAVAGAFAVELGPEAELDLFVGGDIKLGGTASFGNTTQPSRIRVYVAGDSVVLPGGMSIGANVYAPAALVSAGPLEMFGALVANRFSFAGSVSVHYDEAIRRGRVCP
jgi:hypothetical protein